jgi:DNA (cytosine-5)-methyltransferase 1
LTFGKKVRFIDLFAGIGGFHHAALKVFPDAECVMAVEWDKDCQKVYSTMFPETDLRGDIREVLYVTKSGKVREATAVRGGVRLP